MAIDAFMAFIPDDNDPFPIEGESSDTVATGVKGFEIVDFKWGASAVRKPKKKPDEPGKDTNKPGNDVKKASTPKMSSPTPRAHGPSNLAARSIKVDSFSITKPIDKASMALFRACTTEDAIFGKAKVIFRKLAKGGKPYVYLVFDFQKVRVDKIEWKLASIGENTDKPEEEDIDFSFAQCNMFYTPQSATGEMLRKSTKTASYSKPLNKWASSACPDCAAAERGVPHAC